MVVRRRADEGLKKTRNGTPVRYERRRDGRRGGDGLSWCSGWVRGRRVYNTLTYIERYVYYIYLNAFRELNEFCGRWSCRSRRRRQLGRFTCACTCVRVCTHSDDSFDGRTGTTTVAARGHYNRSARTLQQ